ncbi:MAG: hypothetical protein COX15_01000 [Candidatus Colwellbacteria bacterium CG23_combo_of_CG06-09_8_20_14_all_42_19]|uniref:Uncharacterized protein n=1 Tax=Candidatus Colwellbacteria bacterium CG23_combo_of_CG06-09_8_20_14_all_42_19 TaxID=1974541 RepID=A0A2H0ALK0_9BACT|nr:MAG: hypothetical protein COX15_01000 [Candidatus Colwellbacteria bacterium CG23_combo_of_CG06-09_8_20_14_all_42_19]
MRLLLWTNHSRAKMRQYKLSESRVKRVLNRPERVEEGIADKTVTLMQPAGTAKHPYEIWVMAQDTAKRRKVISAWRYPGKTKPGEPLPERIMREFREASKF